MTKGIAMEEIAKILLVIFVLLALIILVITQRQRLGEMISKTLNIGDSSLDQAEAGLQDSLGFLVNKVEVKNFNKLPEPV